MIPKLWDSSGLLSRFFYTRKLALSPNQHYIYY